MNRRTARFVLALLGVLLVWFLARGERRETPTEFFARGERLNRDCRPIAGGRFVYRTAAGFQLSVPTWLRGFPTADHYTPDCRLNYLRIDFAWIDGRLLPLPQNGVALPPGVAAPSDYEPVVVMMDFRDPALDLAPDPVHWCRNRQPRYDYPTFDLRMCPSDFPINGAARPLGFTPRFEIGGQRGDPVGFGCDAADFEGRTAADIHEARINACRGYWHWKPGAYAIVDIERGKVLQKAGKVMQAVAQMLDAWVVSAPAVP